MDRRKFLLTGASITTFAVAGCTGDDDDDEPEPADDDDDNGEDHDDGEEQEEEDEEDEEDDEDEDEDDDADEDVAADHIENATAEIQSAFDLLIETINDDDLRLDVPRLSGYLDGAADELDDSEPLATEQQREQIEELRDVIQYLSHRGDAEATVDEGFEDHLGEGLEQYWDGRDVYAQEPVTATDLQTAAGLFDEAELTFEDAESAFETAQAAAEDAQSVLDDITPDVVDSFEDISYDDAAEEVEGFIWFMDQMQPFADGVGDGCRAWHHVSQGFAAFEEENWVEGESEFGMANSSFDAAVTTLETVAEDALGFMVEFFGEMLCEIGEGPEASEFWIEAAQDAQEGDQEGHEDSIDAGWNLVVECHEE